MKFSLRIGLIFLGCYLAACAPVQPWERGNLAKPQMALDPYPLQSALRAHNYGSREAAAGVGVISLKLEAYPFTLKGTRAVHGEPVEP